MTSRRVGIELVLSLVAGLAVACTSSAGTNAADAAMSVDDLGPVNDLAPSDIDEPPVDGPVEESFDARADLPVDAVVDVAADHPDVFSPDVPGLHVGSAFIPVDPNAVPAPGSECVGDAGVREGDPAIAPPRPVRPLSVSRVTSQRPTFQWVLPEGTTGARVEVCADRCCTRVLQTIDAEGTTVRPMTALPPGVVFWRMFGRRGMAVGSRASYTWEFGVRRRDAPNDTSWGTIRDFNGDGYDDVMVFRLQMEGRRPADLLLMPGSSEGLRAPSVTGVVARHAASRAMVGDFNGDGLADLAWDDRNDEGAIRSWFEIVEGSRTGFRSRVQPDVSMMGDCAVTGDGAVVDWNGDGYSDLIIGVGFGCSFLAPVAASIVLGYSGSPSGIAATPQWVWRADGRFNHSFVSIKAGIGDVDDDGYSDLFVVSAFSGGGTSSVPAEQVLLHGVAEGEPRFERVPQPTPDRGDWARARPASVGDVDGDGYLDVMISLNYSNPLYLYLHAIGWSRPSVTLVNPLNDGYFGSDFSCGDVNGDGLSDVIVSSSLAALSMDEFGIPINAGRVYVFPGSDTGAVAAPISLERERPHAEEVVRQIFGSQPQSPGDLNGDGLDDLTMGDTIAGRLCVRYGRIGFASGSPDACLDGVLTSGSYSY